MKFVGIVALFAALAVPSPSDAAVYAGHLGMVNNGNGTFNLNYRLNEDANIGVTVRVKGPSPAVTTVRTFALGAQTKGAQSVVWDGKNDASANVPVGTYTWEVEASTNNGGTGYAKTVDGTDPINQFFSPYGVDTCDITTSTHFGETYITNRGGTGGAGRLTETGLYILGNDLSDINSKGNTAYTGGVAWPASAGPFRLNVAPDGKVFITDWSDPHSGIWIMNPANPDGPYAELFKDNTRDINGITSGAMHGSISSVHVEGTGPNRVMYTMDEDIEVAGTTQNGSIWKYAIGASDTDFDTTRTVVYDDTTSNIVINFSTKVVRDKKAGRNGFWVGQYRATENASNYCVFHFNGTTVDWNSFADSATNFNNLNSGPIDVSLDGTLLAGAGNGFLRVADVTDLSNDSQYYTDAAPGATKRDVAFDAVGNIILSSSSAETVTYYSKQGTNTFVTPNPVGNTLPVGFPAAVSGWDLY